MNFSDPFTIVLLVVLVVLVIFMFRNSRKRRAEQERLRSSMVPGAEVMTNFGLFGTLLSIDEESNIAQIETSPGTVVKVHRQTLARVVEDTVPAEAGADADRRVDDVDPDVPDVPGVTGTTEK